MTLAKNPLFNFLDNNQNEREKRAWFPTTTNKWMAEIGHIFFFFLYARTVDLDQ